MAIAFLPNLRANGGERRMTMIVVAVPTMLMMLLKTSATLEFERPDLSPWTM